MQHIVAEAAVKKSTPRIKKQTHGIIFSKNFNHGRIYVHGFFFLKQISLYRRVKGWSFYPNIIPGRIKNEKESFSSYYGSSNGCTYSL